MDVFSASERLMAMDNDSWARHANPWSGWSRVSTGTLLFLALWSGFWIGWWSLIPISLAVLWTFANPRLFSPPRSTENWATRGVLGERAFLNRTSIPIPEHHVRMGWITTVIAMFFMALCALGFWQQEFWLAFTGWHAAILAKIWFVDRMVWLWEDVKDSHPVYQAWDRADWTAEISR